MIKLEHNIDAAGDEIDQNHAIGNVEQRQILGKQIIDASKNYPKSGGKGDRSGVEAEEAVGDDQVVIKR